MSAYEEWAGLSLRVGELREQRNTNAKEMKGALPAARRAELVEQGKALKEVIAGIEARLAVAEEELQREGQRVPNDTHPDVPVGGEEVASVRNVVGEPRAFDFPVKDHVALASALDMVDFDSAHTVSGTKFYYLRNAGAMLELALVNWTMQRLCALGFTPIMTPDLVRESVLEKCGFQPRMENTQVYSVEASDLCLTGTAEIPLGGIYMGARLSDRRGRAGAEARCRVSCCCPPRSASRPHALPSLLPLPACVRARSNPPRVCAPRQDVRFWPLLPHRGGSGRGGHAGPLPRAPVQQGGDVCA